MTDPIKRYAMAISVSRLKDERLKRLTKEGYDHISEIHRLIDKLEERVDAIEDIFQDIEVIAVG
jgi:hypothetical protein